MGQTRGNLNGHNHCGPRNEILKDKDQVGRPTWKDRDEGEYFLLSHVFRGINGGGAICHS